MIRQEFNSNWMFSRDVSSMMGTLYGEQNVPVEVMLPHDAMVLEEKNENNPTGNAGAFYPGGNYLYTKTFYMPEENIGKTILLEFEGIYSRWYTGSGIYRPVNMLIGNEAHIKQDGLQITTPEVDTEISTVETKILVRYDGAKRVKAWLETEIHDEDGNVAASEKTPVTLYRETDTVVRQRIFVYEPKLWSLESPNLYSCRTKLVVEGEIQDTAEERFGIRHIQIDPKYGLRLNGKSVRLRGSCIHHDNGVIGSVTLPYAEERRVQLMKEADSSGYFR